jgi:hypothetical protein
VGNRDNTAPRDLANLAKTVADACTLDHLPVFQPSIGGSPAERSRSAASSVCPLKRLEFLETGRPRWPQRSRRQTRLAEPHWSSWRKRSVELRRLNARSAGDKLSSIFSASLAASQGAAPAERRAGGTASTKSSKR